MDLQNYSDNFFTFIHQHYSTSKEDLLTERKTRNLVFLRTAFVVLSYDIIDEHKFIQDDLASKIGRNRSSLPHYEKTHRNVYKTSKPYRENFENFKSSFFKFLKSPTDINFDLKNFTCSIEHSETLFLLGVKQESVLYWYTDSGHYKNKKLSNSKIHTNTDYLSGVYYDKLCNKYSAFTSDELLDMLPSRVEVFKWEQNNYNARYLDFDIKAKSAADSLAKLLIILIRDKIHSKKLLNLKLEPISFEYHDNEIIFKSGI